MLKRISLFLAFLLLSNYYLFSQTKMPSSDYVVLSSGDTLKGSVSCNGPIGNPKKIVIKMGKRELNFLPKEVVSFSLTTENYEKATVKTGTNTLSQIDTLFLQTLIRGSKSLYSYKNKLKEIEFYVKRGSDFELLVYTLEKTITEEKTLLKENKKYLTQISSYLSDCPETQSKQNGLHYKTKDLKELFISYYQNCSSSAINFYNPKSKIKFELKLFTGMTLTSIKFTPGNNNALSYLSTANFNQSTNFTAGVGLDILLPRNSKWSFINELVYSSFETSGGFTDLIFPYIQYTMNFGYSYLKLNTLFRYRIPITNGFFFFINCGISNGLVINEKNNYRRVLIPLTGAIRESKVFDEVRSYEQGYILGLGSRLARYSLEVRLENGNGMSPYLARSSTTRYHILFGYKF